MANALLKKLGKAINSTDWVSEQEELLQTRGKNGPARELHDVIPSSLEVKLPSEESSGESSNTLQVIRDQDDKPTDRPFANPGNEPTENPCLDGVPAKDPGSQPLIRFIPSQAAHLTVDKVQTVRKPPLEGASEPMTGIDELRPRVSEAQQRLSNWLERQTDSADHLRETLLRVEDALARNQSKLETYKNDINQVRDENWQLRQLLDGVLKTIEKSDTASARENLSDLASVTGRLSKIVENAADHLSEPADTLGTAELTSHPESLEGIRIDLGQCAVDQRNKDEGLVTESLLTDKLSLRAIAELWSREIGQPAPAIIAELVAAFQELLGKETDEVTGDTTITRDKLLKVCTDANISPPGFWAEESVRLRCDG